MADTDINDKITTTAQRGNVYGLLASLFREEVSPEFLQQIKDPKFLKVLTDLGADFPPDFFLTPDVELLENLAVEYTRLFLGPGKHISPHESIHHQKDGASWGQLWGDSTVDVKRFIETAGLEYHGDYNGMPDHISVELEFMQQVALRKEQALKEGDLEGAEHCQKIEKKFIKNHLSPWVPDFCKKIIDQAELPFYREVAALTKSFIEFEM
jgi:TorA maturation chaperone TorD